VYFQPSHRRDLTPPNAFIASVIRAGLAIGCAAMLACGGGEPANQTDTGTPAPSSATTTGPADACELLPAAEASAVLGETVRDSVAMLRTEGDRILSQCNYASASSPVVASLMIRRSAPGETVEQASKGVREVMTQGATVEDVPGLGAAAFFGSNQLHVWTNNGWYLIASPSPTGGVAQARAMVEKAIAKL
jgi:hypothetical protein